MIGAGHFTSDHAIVCRIPYTVYRIILHSTSLHITPYYDLLIYIDQRHTSLYHTTLHHTTPHHTATRYATPHHTTPHHIISNSIPPHHITLSNTVFTVSHRIITVGIARSRVYRKAFLHQPVFPAITVRTSERFRMECCLTH